MNLGATSAGPSLVLFVTLLACDRARTTAPDVPAEAGPLRAVGLSGDAGTTPPPASAATPRTASGSAARAAVFRALPSGPKDAPGDVRLTCTNGAPTSVRGGCMCGDSILNPCVDVQSPRMDAVGRACVFHCDATADTAGKRHVRLGCPDGEAPQKTAEGGCRCGGEELRPCGAARSTSTTDGKVCEVTCL